jgi:hypothetical protein
MSKESDLINSILKIVQLRYGFSNSEIRIAPQVIINDEIIKPDIIVYQKVNDRESPAVVIEVKKLLHPLHQEQFINHMRMLGAQYGILSDGNNFIFYKQISENNFIEIPDIPFRTKGAIPFKRSSLNIPTNLHYKLAKITWMISENLRHYYTPEPFRLILSLQKILLCKIVDERSQDSESILYSIPFMVGHKNGDPVDMMNLLFKKVKYLYSDLFNPNESLDLDREVILKAIEGKSN